MYKNTMSDHTSSTRTCVCVCVHTCTQNNKHCNAWPHIWLRVQTSEVYIEKRQTHRNQSFNFTHTHSTNKGVCEHWTTSSKQMSVWICVSEVKQHTGGPRGGPCQQYVKKRGEYVQYTLCMCPTCKILSFKIK